MAELELRLRRGGTPGIVRCRRFGAEISYGTASSGPTANTPWAFDGPVGTPGLYPGMPVGGSRRAIGRGEPILVDYVCSAGGYFVDTSRVFCLGEMPAAAREAHELCGRILRALERLLRPGVPCSRLYQEALELARAGGHADGFMGRGENQVRFVGHGVGLELDELPVLAASFDQPLEAGMTLAVEPKIMLPDAGVGLESTYLVTAGGGESLTPFRAGVEPSN
jgi:Xaa-Pro aminopeptidase